MPATMKSAVNVPPFVEFNLAAIDAARCVLDIEYDAILLMESMDDVAHL